MRVEDLDDSLERNVRLVPDETAEAGFNFDDSSENEQMAALPSIQNEYTL